jgi:hypothetical protein|tara:strand:+ start:405 stop:1259 length:855 start_codon:yes stop_codon:yes gene_type:complete
MPFDLIHTHNENAEFLTTQQLREQVPAAFSDHASPEVSDRYGFISTAAAIDILAQNGFHATKAIQKPSRNSGNELYNDHMITFASANRFEGDGERGTLTLYNSNNARSSCKLYAGVFRYICSNGIVAGEGFEAKMRHSMLTANGFNDLVNDQAKALPALMDNIERLKSIALEYEQVVQLAEQAVQLRWEMEDAQNEVIPVRLGTFATMITVHELSRPRRYGDQGADLWTVFNVAQEALLRGGLPIVGVTKRRPEGHVRKARAIASLSENVRVNRKLWDLANAMA